MRIYQGSGLSAVTLVRVRVEFVIEVPRGATHFAGILHDNPVFFKMTIVGAGGEHWWWFDRQRQAWYLHAHSRPHWIQELAPYMQEEVDGQG